MNAQVTLEPHLMILPQNRSMGSVIGSEKEVCSSLAASKMTIKAVLKGLQR